MTKWEIVIVLKDDLTTVEALDVYGKIISALAKLNPKIKLYLLNLEETTTT